MVTGNHMCGDASGGQCRPSECRVHVIVCSARGADQHQRAGIAPGLIGGQGMAIGTKHIEQPAIRSAPNSAIKAGSFSPNSGIRPAAVRETTSDIAPSLNEGDLPAARMRSLTKALRIEGSSTEYIPGRGGWQSMRISVATSCI